MVSNQVSLSYYQSNDDYSEWILIILSALLYAIICNSIVKSQQGQFVKDTNKNTFRSNYNVMNESVLSQQIKPSTKYAFIKRFLKFIALLILFAGCETFVTLSVMFESIPEHNIFHFRTITIQIIQNSIALF